MYSQITTFENLCEIGCKFIKNEIRTHPFLQIDYTKDNLYELDEKTEWIRNYLYEYNKIGFYTVISQPGCDYLITLYPTYLDYKNSYNFNIKPLDGIYGVKQRAEVEGFMKKHIALKLYSILSNDPKIIIKISFDKNNSIHDDESLNKYMTLSYQIEKNDIRFMEKESEFNESIRLQNKKINRNDKLQKMKHVVRKYFSVRNYPLKKHIPNLIDNDIVGVSIMDLTWNQNDYLWKKIYQSLKNIN